MHIKQHLNLAAGRTLLRKQNKTAIKQYEAPGTKCFKWRFHKRQLICCLVVVGFCVCPCLVFCVFSCFLIILKREREMVALFLLSNRCLVTVNVL